MSIDHDYDDDEPLSPMAAFRMELRQREEVAERFDLGQYGECGSPDEAIPPHARTPAKPIVEIDPTQWRLGDYTQGEAEAVEYCLQPYFPLGMAGVVFGEGGIGKSLQVLDLCIAVASRAEGDSWAEQAREAGVTIPEGTFLPFTPGPFGGNVPAGGGGASLFITLEDDKKSIHRRANSLDPQHMRDETPCYVVPAVEVPGFDATLVETDGKAVALTHFAEHGLPAMIERVESESGYPLKLLALDPAGDLVNGDEDKSMVVKPLMARLRVLAAQYGCCIILIGHVAKGMDAFRPSMRGSGAWVQNGRFGYALVHGTDGIVWGTLTKANHPDAPVGIRKPYRLNNSTGRLEDASGELQDTMPGDADLVRLLVKACADAIDSDEGPLKMTGKAGLFERRAELPNHLASLSRHRLEALGSKALDAEPPILARGTKGDLQPVVAASGPETDPE
jgi:hypothetical protein